jgi:hypothetical protein
LCKGCHYNRTETEGWKDREPALEEGNARTVDVASDPLIRVMFQLRRTVGRRRESGFSFAPTDESHSPGNASVRRLHNLISAASQPHGDSRPRGRDAITRAVERSTLRDAILLDRDDWPARVMRFKKTPGMWNPISSESPFRFAIQMGGGRNWSQSYFSSSHEIVFVRCCSAWGHSGQSSFRRHTPRQRRPRS